MANQHCDLIVIGSGLAGQKGAINAAKLGKRVAVVERDGVMGGASHHGSQDHLVRSEPDHRIEQIHDIQS
jgi:succinate dehydrogenase/fumarate reductase flavoprotein subunit